MADGLEGSSLGLPPDRPAHGQRRLGFMESPLLSRLAVGGLWIGSTIGAALIGATATSFSDRARPTIAISDIRLSPELNDKLHPSLPKIFSDDELFSLIDNSVWLDSVDLSDAGTAYAGLSGDERSAIDDIKIMREFDSRYDTLMSLLDGDDSTTTVNEFFDQIQPLGRYIRNVIDGDIRRGEFTPPEMKTYPPGSRKLMITPSKDNEGKADEIKYFLIHKPGGLHNYVVNITSEGVGEGTLAEIAYALAYFDRPVLRSYLAQAKRDSDKVAEMEKLREKIAVAINGLERLQVNVLISNSGSKPISIAPDAALYINTAEAANFKENTTVKVDLFDGDGHPAPVTVNGGESKVLQFTSVNILAELDNWSDLVTLFNNHSRDCFIAVRTAGTEWQQDKEITSINSHFGLVNPRGFLSTSEIASHFH